MQLHTITAKLPPMKHRVIYSMVFIYQQIMLSYRPINSSQRHSDDHVTKGFILSQWQVNEMDCPVEVTMIEKALSQLPTVAQVDCQVLTRRVFVVHQPEAQGQIEAMIKTLGMTAIPVSEQQKVTEITEKKGQWQYYRLVIAGILAGGAELLDLYQQPPLIIATVAIISIFLSGLVTYQKGWRALWHRQLNINALMSVAVTGAAMINHWAEAAMVMFLFNVAELLESYSLERARKSIQQLINLTPNQARVKQADNQWQLINVENIQIGQILQIRPGEKIPLDGVITEGYSSINQAPITGESTPVEKKKGDRVFAGTINQQGSFCYVTDTTTTETTLAKIIKVVETTQSNKAPIQRVIDQFSRIYTPIIFILAVMVSLVPPLFFAQPWLSWLYKGLVILVIGCPCALVISTPIAIVSALTAATRQGLLIKGGSYLEQGRNLQWLAFDKTGTLTIGKPTQHYFKGLTEQPENQIQQIAASLAANSDHPISLAIAKAATDVGIKPLPVTHFNAIVGRGSEGEIEGQHYYLGNRALMSELARLTSEINQQIDSLEQQGNTVVLLTTKEMLLAIIALADALRKETVEAITQIHQLGVKVMMLTGDNHSVAQKIGQQAGVDVVFGQLLPIDKMAIIQQKIEEGKRIAMIGDGINDAPALAKANIGFALAGIGSDTAIETADITIMDDDLRKIPLFLRLSQRTYRILLQNITLAIGIKGIFLVLTLLGLGTMWMAVFADVGTTLLVIMNGLRLLHYDK